MDKVNRLGWTDGISFTTYGSRFGIRTNNAEVLAEITSRLPFGWQPDPEPVVDMLYSLRVGQQSKTKGRRHYNLLYLGAGRIARSLDMDEVLGTLQESLGAVTPFLAKGTLFVRAGAVGWQGRAILLPGQEVGTTTLLQALIRAGATYYGDSYTLLDPDGMVHPYLTPLLIREAGCDDQREISVEDLGGVAGEVPLPVGLIAWSAYEPGARWRPRSLTPGRAALTLLQSTPAGRNAEFALPVLNRAVREARLIRSKRGEAEATAKALLAAVGD